MLLVMRLTFWFYSRDGLWIAQQQKILMTVHSSVPPSGSPLFNPAVLESSVLPFLSAGRDKEGLGQ
jgi:hypothetical protein